MTTLAAALSALGISLACEDNLNKFANLFQKWNRNINLSAARGHADILDHIVDSLHVIPHLRAARAERSLPLRVLDVGSGGGLPGAVVAICLPEAQVTALEPVHKKHAFLRTAVRELSLLGFEPLAQRLEDHDHQDYDAAMSRATFDLREWLARGLTFVQPDGIVLGFEAIPRPDLPPASVRHSYVLHGKPRAIVTLQRNPQPS